MTIRTAGLFMFEGCVPFKVCSRCGQNKQTAFFNRNRRSADGVQAYCAACSRTYGQKRRAKRREELQRRKIWAESKSCRACRCHRAAEYFPIDVNSRDGLGAVCKSCLQIMPEIKEPRRTLSQKQRRALAMLRLVRNEAKRERQPCDITLDWIVEHLERRQCAETGQMLSITGRRKYHQRVPKIVRKLREGPFNEADCHVIAARTSQHGLERQSAIAVSEFLNDRS